MSLPFELRIALRYLAARRKQAFISVISAISVLGVIVGVMALFVALGLMTGLQQEIRSRILGASGHLSVFKAGSDPFLEYPQVAAKLREVPGVVGAAPAVYGKGIVSSAASQALATFKGVLPSEEGHVTEIGDRIEGGGLKDLAQESVVPAVLLGRDLAHSLGVSVGDVVRVTSPNGHLSPLGMLPQQKPFRVAGLVNTGLAEFDGGWAYVSLASAQRLFGESGVTLVEARLADIYAVRRVTDAALQKLGPGYVTSDWIQMNQSLFSALWLEKVAIGITIGLIVMVAALNIVATLVLMVMEKHKDIAILVSMGASRGAISRIFMLQGTLIGAAGTLTGSLLGWGLCQVLDRYKLIRVPADVYQVSYVPFQLLPGDALTVMVGAMLICFLATLHPARGAARLDPAEALRYE